MPVTSRRRLVVRGALVLLALVPLLGVAAGVRLVRVTSDSMAPGHGTGSRMLALPVRADPERGDVVVVDPPAAWREAFDRWAAGGGDQDDLDLVLKRVVGVGGDSVECCASDGSLVVNGERLDEPYLHVPAGRSNSPTFRTVVPDEHVWLMGDNRPHSFDSRAVHSLAGDGSVPVRLVRSRVVAAW